MTVILLDGSLILSDVRAPRLAVVCEAGARPCERRFMFLWPARAMRSRSFLRRAVKEIGAPRQGPPPC